MKFKSALKVFILFMLSMVLTAGLLLKNARAADIGNCLLCHKYPGISRVDTEGKFRLFYVNEDIFNNSVHAKIKCEGCHTDIKKIPHEPAKKVDCLTQCHIVEPSSEQKFSHQDVSKFLSASVHGEFDTYGNPKNFPEDLPKCKDCHQKEAPLLPFRELGYPSHRIDAIVSTEVVGMIKNYTQFYMPRMLHPGEGDKSAN